MSGASLTPGQADTLVNRNPVVPARSAGSAHYPFLLPAAEPGELGRLGNYRVLRVLGSGGMCTVFAAEDVALRRPVALKVMHPELAADPDNNGWQRFLREARSLAGIKHRHLVTVYQAFEERGAACLVMELLEGESLEGRLRRTPPPDVAEVVRVGREVAVGLAALHDRGLVHRDVKPGNVWLEAPDGHVKILDLGLVRSAAEEMHLTESGMVVGTPAYMSPEQVRGKAVDARSDLFSLGCVLYTLCTGRPPFEGDTPLARAAALAADEPPPARGLNRAVPRALSDLIAELLAKNPNDRPTTAAEVADRLRDIGRSP